MTWLRQKLLWSLGESVMVLAIGPSLSVALSALTLLTVYYSGYHHKDCGRRVLSQSWNFVGIRMALVGTEVFLLRYGLWLIANLLQTSGIMLEHFCYGIPVEHIGRYYFPLATIFAFQFSRISFRCMIALWVCLHFPSSEISSCFPFVL